MPCNLEKLGISKLIFIENNGVLFIYPEITDLETVNLETNGAYTLEIERIQVPRWTRTTQNSDNYIEKYKDSFSFYSQMLKDSDLYILRNSRNGFIVVAELVNGEKIIFQTPVFISKANDLNINNRSSLIELDYKVPTFGVYLNLGEIILPPTELQHLFTVGYPIDFENNVITDKIGNYNASFSGGSYGIKYRDTSLYMNLGNFLNLNNDFTVFVDFDKLNLNATRRVSIFSSGIGIAYNHFAIKTNEGGFAFQIIINSSTRTFNVPIVNGRNLICMKKSGSDYTFYNNQSQGDTLNIPYTYPTNLDYLIGGGVGGEIPLFRSHCVIKRAMSDAEILAISNNFDLIDLVEAENSTDNRLWLYNTGDITAVDICAGDEVTIPLADFSLDKTSQEYSLMKTGADIYSLDSNPTEKKLINLKYDGTSLGKVISGYTFQETLIQDGYSFLNLADIKLDNTNIPNPPDLNDFYATAKEFNDIVLENETYIEKTIIGNKINDLKIF